MGNPKSDDYEAATSLVTGSSVDSINKNNALEIPKGVALNMVAQNKDDHAHEIEANGEGSRTNRSVDSEQQKNDAYCAVNSDILNTPEKRLAHSQRHHLVRMTRISFDISGALDGLCRMVLIY